MFMNGLLQDVRYALRQLRNKPAFASTAVLTLALGIGANTAMFSVINAVLLRPLPYKDPGRIVVFDGISSVDHSNSGREWADWAAKSKALEDITVYQTGQLNLADVAEPERVPAVAVSPRFFALLGIAPEMGRAALSPDEESGNPHVALISNGLWRSHCGADPGIVGRVIHLNGRAFTIIGVTPPGFAFPQQSEIWLLHPQAGRFPIFTTAAIVITQMGRLRPGVNLAQARTELQVFAQESKRSEDDRNSPIQISTLHENLTRNVRSSLLVLFASVGFVLLIACANVANLLLARNSGRLRELAIRSAVGATVWDLMRPLLTESCLLSIAGAGAGLAVAKAVVLLAGHLIPSPSLPARPDLDAAVLLFTLGIAVMIGLLCGIAPALQLSKIDPNEALKDGSPDLSISSMGARHRLSNWLATAEVGLALMLLIGSGLLIRSLVNLVRSHPGFRTDHLMTARVDLAGPAYQTPQQRVAFFDQVSERIKTIPGVRSAAFTSNVPLSKDLMIGFFCGIEGISKPQQGPLALYYAAAPGYFGTMGIPLLEGRDFNERDRAGAQPAVIVSQSAARQFWPNQYPIGKHITIQDPARWMEVVGVVGDVKDGDLSDGPAAEIYVPIQQQPPSLAFLVVETTSAPAALAADIRRLIQSADKSEPVSSFRTGSELLSLSTSDPRQHSLLLSVFSCLALVLAAVGVYGIMAHAVARRRHEIGVRTALGAQSSDVFKLVLWQGAKLALAGVGIGLAGSFGLTRFLQTFLYGVSAFDPETFVLVSLLLLAVTLLASYIPARRAAKVDPMVALRYE
jgi:putative ABC transport system permease protein